MRPAVPSLGVMVVMVIIIIITMSSQHHDDGPRSPRKTDPVRSMRSGVDLERGRRDQEWALASLCYRSCASSSLMARQGLAPTAVLASAADLLDSPSTWRRP